MLPMWMDTLDNANRVHELGFGIKLDTNKFTESELMRAIDALLGDTRLTRALTRVSKRILSGDRLAVAATLVENVVHMNE